MTCENLAVTGADAAWVAILVVALLLLGFGLTLRRRAGARGRTLGAVLLVVCVVGVWSTGSVPPSHAACHTPPTILANSLTIEQTSDNGGMSPARAPSSILGRVTNNGPDETFVTSVSVSISAVVKAPGAATGVCDASDYILTDHRMPVGTQLAAGGGSAVFSGALIGFLDKASNQDACKGAVVELVYVAE